MIIADKADIHAIGSYRRELRLQVCSWKSEQTVWQSTSCDRQAKRKNKFIKSVLKNWLSPNFLTDKLNKFVFYAQQDDLTNKLTN